MSIWPKKADFTAFSVRMTVISFSFLLKISVDNFYEKLTRLYIPVENPTAFGKVAGMFNFFAPRVLLVENAVEMWKVYQIGHCSIIMLVYNRK